MSSSVETWMVMAGNVKVSRLVPPLDALPPPLPATPTPKVRVGVPGSASGAFVVCSSFFRLCLR